MTKSPLTIEAVEEQFTIWRNSKKGHPAIPAELCSHVQSLLQFYPHPLVLRRLGLTIQQARNKGLLLASTTTAATCTTNTATKIDNSQSIQTPSFVQVTMPSSITNVAAMQHKIGVALPKTATLTLQRGDAQLSLTAASESQIQLIIQAFLG